jgi:hypothetical protein
MHRRVGVVQNVHREAGLRLPGEGFDHALAFHSCGRVARMVKESELYEI